MGSRGKPGRVFYPSLWRAPARSSSPALPSHSPEGLPDLAQGLSCSHSHSVCLAPGWCGHFLGQALTGRQLCRWEALLWLERSGTLFRAELCCGSVWGCHRSSLASLGNTSERGLPSALPLVCLGHQTHLRKCGHLCLRVTVEDRKEGGLNCIYPNSSPLPLFFLLVVRPPGSPGDHGVCYTPEIPSICHGPQRFQNPADYSRL